MAKYIEHKKIWEMLHGIGGCDAEPESWADGWDKAIDAAIGELDKLPAADVQEVEHGEWRELEKNVYAGKFDQFGDPIFVDKKYFRCSKCKRGNIYKSCYCPNCGAKMDGKDDEI